MKATSTDRADLYRRAAKLMESGNSTANGSCCWAIGLTKNPGVMILYGDKDADCRAMKAVYAPRKNHGFWMNDIGDNDHERHNGRILALCFMAAMVEAGDA